MPSLIIKLCFGLLVYYGSAVGLYGSVTSGTSNPIVRLDTTYGSIFIELYAKEAPISTKNFLDYAREGYYDQTIFHRVIDNFMVQGGGFNNKHTQKDTHEPIKNEADNGLINKRGSVAMARTNIIDSATSQFFINVTNNSFLNHSGKSAQGYGYAVFGQVIDGMDVVDKIKVTPTHTGNIIIRGKSYPVKDVPKTPVIINKAHIIKDLILPESEEISDEMLSEELLKKKELLMNLDIDDRNRLLDSMDLEEKNHLLDLLDSENKDKIKAD